MKAHAFKTDFPSEFYPLIYINIPVPALASDKNNLRYIMSNYRNMEGKIVCTKITNFPFRKRISTRRKQR